VGVGGPGVGKLAAGHKRAQRRGRGGPEAESAADVDPGVAAARQGDAFGERIERSGMDVAGLQADDGGAVVFQQGGQRRRKDPAFAIHAHGCRRTKAKKAQCQVKGVVAFLADKDPDAGRSGEAEGVDVPALVGKDLAAPGGEAGRSSKFFRE